MNYISPDGLWVYQRKKKEIILKYYTKLQEAIIVVPESMEGLPVTKIARGCFSYVFAAKIIVPETVTHLCFHSFLYCDVEIVTLPTNIRFPRGCFTQCNRLQTIAFYSYETQQEQRTMNCKWSKLRR